MISNSRSCLQSVFPLGLGFCPSGLCGPSDFRASCRRELSSWPFSRCCQNWTNTPSTSAVSNRSFKGVDCVCKFVALGAKVVKDAIYIHGRILSGMTLSCLTRHRIMQINIAASNGRYPRLYLQLSRRCGCALPVQILISTNNHWQAEFRFDAAARCLTQGMPMLGPCGYQLADGLG